MIEFPISHSAEKRLPFVWRKPQDRALGVLAVADAYLTARQVRHLYAVAVGKAQGALHPVRVTAAPSRAVPERWLCHVHTSWMWCDGWPHAVRGGRSRSATGCARCP